MAGSGRRSAASLRQTAPAPSLYELREMLRQLLVHAEQIPEGLYLDLRQLLERQIAQIPWSMERVHAMRWAMVGCRCQDGKKLVDISFPDSAFTAAAEALADLPAAGGPAAIKASYYEVEAQRRDPHSYLAQLLGAAPPRPPVIF